MAFNNNWVPGLPGYAYTRNPGLWLDFMVTSVTHTFSVSSDFQAQTVVSFGSGRYSTEGESTGVEQDTFYAYDKS